MEFIRREYFRIGAFLAVFLLLTGCFGRQDPAPVLSYGQSGGASSAGVHTAMSGDTVWSIAERYQLSMQDVIHVNNLRPPYKLAVGQRIELPPPNIYNVREGDTLYAISRTFSVNMNELARQNNMSAPYVVRLGDSLRLPSVAPPKPATRTAAAAPAGSVTREALAPPVSGQRSQARASRPPQGIPGRVPQAQTPQRSASKFSWPVSGPVISSYGPKPGGLHNDGINISAAKGTPVKAAENGVVVYADNQLRGFGNLVLVRHADRWMTAYAHMDRTVVRKGQQVKRGEKVGEVGMTGSVDTPQLHFEVRRGTEALNPAAYLAAQGS